MAADVGKSIKVRVSFTDGGGTLETLVSAATAAIARRPPLPEVSIAAASSSPVTEGNDVVFTLRRTGAATAPLTVAVSVSEAGGVLRGTAPSEVTFPANVAETQLTVATEDDDVAEADARVTAAVAAGARTASVDVLDNDRTTGRSCGLRRCSGRFPPALAQGMPFSRSDHSILTHGSVRIRCRLRAR